MPVFVTTFLAAMLVIMSLLGFSGYYFGFFNYLSSGISNGLLIFLGVFIILAMIGITVLSIIIRQNKRGSRYTDDDDNI